MVLAVVSPDNITFGALYFIVFLLHYKTQSQSINGCGVRAVVDVGESESMLRQVERAVREWLIDASKSVHSVSLGCFALYCEDDAVRDHVVDSELSFDSRGVFVRESKKKKK